MKYNAYLQYKIKIIFCSILNKKKNKVKTKLQTFEKRTRTRTTTKKKKKKNSVCNFNNKDGC